MPPGEVLRAAYRAAARKYHPDRNPAGRDKFQAAAAAYERLTSMGSGGGEGSGAGSEGGGAENGSDSGGGSGATRRWRLLLLLRAQRLLYARAGGALSPYRYAGFPPLLRTVARSLAGLPDGDVEASAALARLSREGKRGGRGDESSGEQNQLLLSLALSEDKDESALPPREHFLSASSAPLILAAADLAAATASASPENNGAELARCGGVGVLAAALSRAAAALTVGSGTDAAPAAKLSASCLRALEAMACSGNAAPVAAMEAVAGGSGSGGGGGESGTAATNTSCSLFSTSFHLASDVVHVASLRGAPSAAAAAVNALAALSCSARLQDAMLEAGAVQALVPLLFGFDPTLGDEEAAAAAGRAEGAHSAQPQHPQQQQQQMLLQSSWAAATTAATLPAAPSSYSSSCSTLIAAPAHQQQQQPLAAPVSLPELAPMSTASSTAAASPHRSATAERNDLALRAARALAALAGVGSSSPSPPNAAARAALAALLTPPLARRLAAADHAPLLSDLAGAVRSPAAVWDASMRSLLLSTLEGAVASSGGPGQVSSSVAELARFRYPSLEGELVVSGVYVRAYCAEPGFPLDDGAAFLKGLVSHVHDFVQKEEQEAEEASFPAADDAEADAKKKKRQKEKLTARRHLAESLRALRLALEACPRAAAVMASRPALAPLLAVVERGTPKVKKEQEEKEEQQHGDAAALVLAALVRLTAHAGCVAALSEKRALRAAYFAAHRPPTFSSRALALRLLSPLVGSGGGGGEGEVSAGGGGSGGGSVAGTEAAWEACASGGAMCLLSIVLPKRKKAAAPSRSSPAPGEDEGGADASAGGAVGDPTPDQRAAAAALLGRLASHPLHGGRVTLLLRRLLPPGAVAVLLDGPGDVAADALRRDADTPEHVWSGAMAAAAADDADAWASSAAAADAAAADSSSEWTPPPPSSRSPLDADSLGASLLREPYVGGVYVRRFLRSPGARLRDPAAFLQGLLDAFARAARGAAATAASSSSSSSSKKEEEEREGPSSSDPGDDDARISGFVAEAVLMSAAACELLGGRPALRERAAALGVVRACLSALSGRLPAAAAALPSLAKASSSSPAPPPPPPPRPDELGGSALRLLHASLAGSAGAADALAAEPPAALAPLVAPAGLGAAGGAWGVAAEVLAAEALTRALEAASRGRASLVASACAAGAVPALLARLERQGGGRGGAGGGGAALVPSAGGGDDDSGDGGGEASRDACVARVACISCLRALSEYPAGGQPAAAAAAALERSAAWRDNAGVRHDLYLPSGAEAGGSSGEGVARLLSGNSALSGARFALPAPEALVVTPVLAAVAAEREEEQQPVRAEPASVVAPPIAVVVAREPPPPTPPVVAREPSPPPPPSPPRIVQRESSTPPPPPIVEREPSPPPQPQREATPEAEVELEEEPNAVDTDGENSDGDDGLDPLGADPPTPVPADKDPLQD